MHLGVFCVWGHLRSSNLVILYEICTDAFMLLLFLNILWHNFIIPVDDFFCFSLLNSMAISFQILNMKMFNTSFAVILLLHMLMTSNFPVMMVFPGIMLLIAVDMQIWHLINWIVKWLVWTCHLTSSNLVCLTDFDINILNFSIWEDFLYKTLTSFYLVIFTLKKKKHSEEY